MLRNYLVEALKSSGSQSDFDATEIQTLDLQMKMLVYQTLDVFDEKQKLKGGSKPAPGGGSSSHTETTYLGNISNN